MTSVLDVLRRSRGDFQWSLTTDSDAGEWGRSRQHLVQLMYQQGKLPIMMSLRET